MRIYDYFVGETIELQQQDVDCISESDGEYTIIKNTDGILYMVLTESLIHTEFYNEYLRRN